MRFPQGLLEEPGGAREVLGKRLREEGMEPAGAEMKKQEFVVKVEPHWSMTKMELYKKLKAWIEHYGHTASSYGFDFEEIRYIGEDE